MIPVPSEVLLGFQLQLGLDEAELDNLNKDNAGGDGAVYEYEQHGRLMLLKVMAVPDDNPVGLANIKERMDFARFLGQHDVAVAHPELLPDGGLFLTQHHGQHTFVAYIMRKAPGKIVFPQHWSPPLYTELGRTLGKLHRATKSYPNWQPTAEGTAESARLGWQEEWHGFYGWCKDEDVRECWENVRSRLVALPVTRECFGFIHNDPHPFNILVDNGKLVLLDFDVANYHWFLNDIAIASQGVLFSISGGLDRPVANLAPLQQFFADLLYGYNKENALDAAWLQHLDLFISYRRILLFIVFYKSLVQKPDVLARWKRMILSEPRICN